jgi:ATP-dependent protease ClpP protease subunit
MAAILLQYCTERYATHSSTIMFHDASTTLDGNINFVRSELEYTNNMLMIADMVVANRLKIDYNELKRKEASEWWTVGAQQAIQQNLIDDEAVIIIDPKDVVVYSTTVQFNGIVITPTKPDKRHEEKKTYRKLFW